MWVCVCVCECISFGFSFYIYRLFWSLLEIYVLSAHARSYTIMRLFYWMVLESNQAKPYTNQTKPNTNVKQNVH